MKNKENEKIIKTIFKQKKLLKYDSDESDYYFMNLLKESGISLSTTKLSDLNEYTKNKLRIQNACDRLDEIHKASYYRFKTEKDIDDYIKYNINIYKVKDGTEFFSKKAAKLYLLNKYINKCLSLEF